MFGDPHIYTFDDVQYTFNGLGEFVLVRVDSPQHVLDVQGRFERIPENFQVKVLICTINNAVINIFVSAEKQSKLSLPRYGQEIFLRLNLFITSSKSTYFA